MIWQQAKLNFESKRERVARLCAPGLEDGWERTKLRFGTATIEVDLQLREGQETTLTIGKRIAHHLRLPPRSRIGFLHKTNDKTLILGPLFAILTNSGARNEALFGKRTGTCKEILGLAEERGMVGMVLTEKSHITNDQASGFIMGAQRWREQSLPLPKVTYDRLATRRSVSQHKLLGASRLLRKGIYFNPEYLDKWQTYSLITCEEPVLGWPYTRSLSAHNLAALLKEYPLVYIKPAASSLGKGIMTVARLGDKWLLQQHVAKGKIKRFTSTKLSRIWLVIQNATKNKRYIVQQGIELMRYKQAPFDVRVLVQKDGDAIWQVMGMGARVAATGGIVTHVPNGGYRLPLKQVLPESSFEDIVASISWLVLEAANRLQDRSDQLWGELSFDVGIDPEGTPWILEINSHPFRFDERHIRMTARRTLLDYICNLSAEMPEVALK